MSKWIIVSDNHTESGVLYQIYEMHPDADVYLHLGDSEFAYDDTELSLFNRVKGNCDFYPEFENEAVAKYNDVKAFYTHGHLYQVNRTRDLLAEKGLELGCLLHFMDIHMWQNMSILMVFMLLILEVYLNLEVQWKKHMLKLLLMIKLYMAPSISKIDITKQSVILLFK